MFKKKVDPEKERMRKQLEAHAMKVQKEHDRKVAASKRLLDQNYVNQQMQIQQQQQAAFESRQNAMIQKSMEQIKKTELKSFKCGECGSAVDMQNLTCPNCGQLYCQWCGAKMDMMNPGMCPRCNRPPFYTPAESVITKVEDIAPEDRFWEDLPTCPKCGAAIQPDWPDCPFCGAKFDGVPAAPSKAGAVTPSDEQGGKKRKKDKKKGI